LKQISLGPQQFLVPAGQKLRPSSQMYFSPQRPLPVDLHVMYHGQQDTA
jgi:hypothetical protein